MNIKIVIGAVLIAIGILGAVLSATADLTGLNVTQDDKDYVEFGWVQTTAFAIGVLILLAGIVFAVLALLKKKTPEPAPQPPAATPEAEETKEIPVKGPPATAQPQQEAQTYQSAQTEQSSQMQYEQQGQATQEQAQQAQESSESISDLDGLEGLDSLSSDLGIDMGAGDEYECPDCGAKLSADATACSSCGANFSEEVFECPVCGTEVSKDAKECSKCGEQLADSFVDAKKE